MRYPSRYKSRDSDNVTNPHDTVRIECARELWSGPLSAEELSRRTVYPPATIALCLSEDPTLFECIDNLWHLIGKFK